MTELFLPGKDALVSRWNMNPDEELELRCKIMAEIVAKRFKDIDRPINWRLFFLLVTGMTGIGILHFFRSLRTFEMR